ncbi:high choriolytic enzyme 2-like isoform X2 [Hippoglossus hippoglossus]|uniref:high choriolytic enzyme 2-like isoform X1 n=1 Tax=Hippoglossus hippoglossus TaxID=8267 RepID=UPI00148DC340|nr:high choriolytic enzyme 2-like isoform X1 [Hippoglossus hippoglossus]XP_034425629.1 high choriolytic enzyme 2-like isoform X2 [Hippoglossus hippoglossus]
MTPVFLLLLFFSMTAIAPGEAEEDLSDIIEKANAGSTNLEDGDIVQNSNRNAARCTYYGCKWPKRGTRVTVPVAISSRYSRSERNTIIRGLVSFHRSTCIRFVWRRYRWQRDYIYFYSGSGCSSNIGRKGGPQLISLKKNACVVNHVVQHEILHALGFHHEHKRSDRDRYVRINWGNIKPSKKHNFKRARTNNLWTRYDFNSIMHYGKNFFSKNGKPTIVGRNPSQVFGRARSMSRNDILRVNRLYRC